MQLYKGLIDFLKDLENRELLAHNDFDTLYHKAAQDPYILDASHLTELFREAGIDPLPYLSNIPSRYDFQSHITRLHIPDNISAIGIGAFAQCTRLQSITLGDNVQEISRGAFRGCKRLKEINWNTALHTIGSDVFEGCNLVSLSIPNNVETIRLGAFRDNEELKDAKLPRELEAVSAFMFTGCSQLSEITLGSECRMIELSAFEGCDNLETVNFDGSMQEWQQITIRDWNEPIYLCTVKCRDGNLEYDTRIKKWIEV